ncbi:MAG: histidinol-phosphatase HisJ family protein [Christensenellales bacterium]
MYDYHLHSRYSADSETPMEHMAQQAQSLGLREICFTDHVDIGFSLHGIAFEVDLPAYLENLTSLRKKYPALPIKAGLEVGHTPENTAATAALLADCPLDFIIASVHLLDGEDIFCAGYTPSMRKKVYQDYLLACLHTAKTAPQFNVLGHVNYPSKLPVFCDKPLYYDDAPDILDEIFRALIARGKGIEINTSPLRKTRDIESTLSYMRRYRALGGEIITLGSDAHRPETIGFLFPEMIEALKSQGFAYLCTFDRQSPIFHSL